MQSSGNSEGAPRLIVFAYHDIGCACLEELIRTGDPIAAVITHRDDPGEEVWFRSVAELGRRHNLPVFTPESINTPEWIARLREMRPDFLFSFYYRHLLSREVLALPSRGALNLHGSLLPRYRGRCPINWVLVHGETETGVTLHYMEEKPDRGDIVAQRRVPISETDTALDLARKLTPAAAALLRDTYPLLRAGTAPRRAQDQAEATYFGGRRPEDGRIDWSWSARRIYNLVRAVTHPYPGAFTCWDGKRLYVWEARPVSATLPAAPGTVTASDGRALAATGEGALEILRLQLEGETETSAVEWLRRRGLERATCR